MPSTYKGRTYYHTKRRVTAAQKIQRAFRRMKNKRKGKARPSKAISTGYRGAPNQYRFVRETRPTIIDVGNAADPAVTHIAGTGAIPNTAVVEFANFQINQLAGGFTQFSDLFANYKIDKIETILIPQWSQNTQPTVNPQTGAWTNTSVIPNLMVTRINTKYLIGGYTLPATAELNRDELAQIVKKTRSLYGTKKWLRVNTSNPAVEYEIEDGSGGQNLALKRSPWLSTVDAADQEYSMNTLFFCDKLDGTNFFAGVYTYRMFHRIHFRCAFVG